MGEKERRRRRRRRREKNLERFNGMIINGGEREGRMGGRGRGMHGREKEKGED